MPEVPNNEQLGDAAVWFSTQAGVTALVLAVVCIVLAIYVIYREIECRKERKAASAAWAEAIRELSEGYGRRVDQMRNDVKDAFAQNDKIAEKVVSALHALQMEVARLSARRN